MSRGEFTPPPIRAQAESEDPLAAWKTAAGLAKDDPLPVAALPDEHVDPVFAPVIAVPEAGNPKTHTASPPPAAPINWEILETVALPQLTDSSDHEETIAVLDGAQASGVQCLRVTGLHTPVTLAPGHAATSVQRRLVQSPHPSALEDPQRLECFEHAEIALHICQPDELTGRWLNLARTVSPRLRQRFSLGLEPALAHYRGIDLSAAGTELNEAASDPDRRNLLPRWLLDANACDFAEDGASAQLELAIVLAACADNLRWALRENISASFALPATTFSLSASPDVPTTMAKFRALRLLIEEFARACTSSGEPDVPRTVATTLKRSFSTRDPWNNLTRGALAGLAAALGGAQVIGILPCGNDPAAIRSARDTNHLLRTEVLKSTPEDPANGSPTWDHLRDKIAESAWKYFQTIEHRGGLVETLNSGWLAQLIRQQREARQSALENGTRIKVGEQVPSSVSPFLRSDRL